MISPFLLAPAEGWGLGVGGLQSPVWLHCPLRDGHSDTLDIKIRPLFQKAQTKTLNLLVYVLFLGCQLFFGKLDNFKVGHPMLGNIGHFNFKFPQVMIVNS